MPRMPFIGVLISWLMEARKRDLAWLAVIAWSRASASASSAARCSVMSRPTLWISLTPPSWPADGEVLPHEPARARRRSTSSTTRLFRSEPPLGEVLLVAIVENREMEHLAERRLALHAEGPAEGVVDEGQPLVGIAAQDDVALMVEQVAIARFALAHLPLQILEGLQGSSRDATPDCSSRALPVSDLRSARKASSTTPMHQRRQDERGGEAEHVGGEPDEAHAEDRKRHPQANPAGAISAEALPYLTLHC